MKIKLFGEKYVLMGTLDFGGPIGTEEQIKYGATSFANLDASGKIWSYLQVIGTRDDIKVIEKDKEVRN